MHFKVHQPAENYILLDFGNKINEEINKYMIALSSCIKHEAVLEVIPAYSSILVEFDESKISSKKLYKYINSLKPDIAIEQGKTHIIPVAYGGEFGPDLKHVAAANNLTKEEVINIHSSNTYRVYMLGFMPGFCYLGGLNSNIACKRKKEPRLKIPKGSVGIAGQQTGIYPSESPGGWQIIGRTTFELYRPKSEEIFPVNAGDIIIFKPVVNGREL